MVRTGASLIMAVAGAVTAARQRTFRLNGRARARWRSLMHEWPRRGPKSFPAAFWSAILPVLVVSAFLTWPMRGAESGATDDSASAAVLRRFILGQEGGHSWPVETLEIEASLPKLKKTGNLRAIRRLRPAGDPEYQVLEVGGDPTVEHQVISRYIAADKRANAVPYSSLAITPANYSIHCIGTVARGNRLVYVFRMIPRSQREGLLNGVVWLDGETGLALRESGYLAKTPSALVKRIDVTREYTLDECGKVAAKITHLAVETRVAGGAQLLVIERPISDKLATGSVAGDGK